MSYLTRRLEEADIGKLQILFKSAFNTNVSKLSISKKYFDSYQKRRLSYITIGKNGDPASFYGMIFQKSIINGKMFEIGQSCDSMTHKSHVGKGLFVNLANATYENALNEGIDLIFGFPNETIYDLRIKKLGWCHRENIHVFKININPFSFSGVAFRIPIIAGLYINYVKLIIKKHMSAEECFDNSCYTDQNAVIVHDKDYFMYKGDKNKFVLELNGIKFWVKISNNLIVGDFENCNIVVFKQAFQILRKIAFKLGCKNIIFQYQEGSKNELLLREIFAVDSKMPVGFKVLNPTFSDFKFKFCGADFDTW